MHPAILGLEAQRNMLLDKIHHIRGDHPEFSETQLKEEEGQLQFSLRLCEARIEKSKEEVSKVF